MPAAVLLLFAVVSFSRQRYPYFLQNPGRQLLLPGFQVLADGGVAAGAEQFAHALDRRVEAASEQSFGGGSNFFVADSGTGHGIDGTS